MRKIILAALLALLVPVCALAAEVELGGVTLARGTYYDVDASGLVNIANADQWSIHFSADGATLTLDGVNYDGMLRDSNGLTAVGDLTIVLAPGSENTIIGCDVPRPGQGETWEASWGISVDGDLTIRGAGTLNAVGGIGGSSYGIIALSHSGNGATLTITDATVIATGRMAGAFSKGLYSHRAMKLNNAVVTAVAGQSGYYSYGLDAGGLTATDSEINVSAAHSDFHSLGVYASMKLTRCTLKVTADPDSSYSNALCGNLTMEGGSAEFRGATAAVELDDADGLSLSKELQVRGAATYDGALGEVTLPEGGKSFLAGNAEAQLVVIAPAEKPEPSPVPVPETPATGDGAHPALWLALMAFAGAAAIAAQRKCR